MCVFTEVNQTLISWYSRLVTIIWKGQCPALVFSWLLPMLVGIDAATFEVKLIPESSSNDNVQYLYGGKLFHILFKEECNR